MRFSPLILALPALATAQEQFPFINQVKGWFAQASKSITSAIPSAPSISIPSIPNPVASGAKKIASLSVNRITLDNHKQLLAPGAATASPGIEEWLIFVTGGNKTCYGVCGHSETAFNESVALISASPSPPNLGMIDCEKEGVLCYSWLAQAPTILHILIPQPLPDQSQPSVTYRSIDVNRTSVTPTEIAALTLQQKYKETEPYEGIFKPFDGPLAKYDLNLPMGYALWGFSKVPSWMFMIGISMLSRSFM